MNKLFILFFAASWSLLSQGQTVKQADSLVRYGKYSKAIALYQTVNTHNENAIKIARAYYAIGNYDQSLNYYKEAIKAFPKNQLYKLDYGKLLYRVKKYKEASEIFHQLIDMDYKNPNYHYEAGLALEKLNDSTAQNRFYSAFELDSTHQKAIFRMARFHVAKRHYKTANKYIDIGLESYANNTDLISLKAQNYYWNEDYEKAVKWFEKLIDLNESTPFIHNKLAYAYYKILKYHKALEHTLIALELEPSNTDNIYFLARLYSETDDFENAEKYLLEYLKISDPSRDEEYQKLGYIYNRQKKHDMAIKAYQKAVDENPESDSAFFFLVLTKGQYYEDIETRIALYESFLEKFPNSYFKEMAKKRISELKEEKFLKEDKK
jgi:tetratricopeptide (TPR) repeat protein